jgi:hypothetical protein
MNIALNSDLKKINYVLPNRMTLAEAYKSGKKLIEYKQREKDKGILPVETGWEDAEDTIYRLGSTTEPIYVPRGSNQFLEAVLYAYNNHLSLDISPDVILMCVSMAVSTCMSDHAEDYRAKFVNHEGKKELVVALNGSLEANHSEFISIFDYLIDKEVKVDLGLNHNFTTSTPVIRTTSAIIKMATYKEYFECKFICMCGIRNIRLQGTLQDWQHLKEKVINASRIIDKHMINWFKHIIYIIDRMIETYQLGDNITDDLRVFWNRIISLIPLGSGSDVEVSGWIKVLLTGVHYDKIPEVLPVLDSKSKAPYLDSYDDEYKDWMNLNYDIPEGCVYITNKCDENGYEHDIYTRAGFLGFKTVSEDEEIYIEPYIGYTVHS